MTVRTGVALLLVFGFAPAHAQVVRQVTDLKRTETTEMALSDDGSVGFFISNATPDHTWQVFRWTLATGISERITAVAGGVEPTANRLRPAVTDDGSLLVVIVDRRAALLQADGSGLAALTSAPADPYWIGISGNGHRVVFESRANLTGANPTGATQVFAVEHDGTGLRQVTSETGFAQRFPSISDDGVRIAFSTSKNPGVPGAFGQIAGVNHDGTGFRFLTSVAGMFPLAPRISGNGQSVAYATFNSIAGCSTGNSLLLVDWEGGSPVLLRCPTSPCTGTFVGGSVDPPDITDDAQTIVYSALDGAGFGCEEQVFRVQRNGTGLTDLTRTASQSGPEAACDRFVSVSGDGSRISYTCWGGEPWGGPNPDLSNEAYAATGLGSAHVQVSRTLDGDSFDVETTGDGSQIVFVSSANPTGATGLWIDEIHKSAADGSGVVKLTAFGDWLSPPRTPTVSDDGAVVAFRKGPSIYSVRGDGAQLRELVDGDVYLSSYPQVSPTGAVIVFASNNPLGEAGVIGTPLYRIAPDGSGLARVTSKTGSARHPRIDVTGTYFVYATTDGGTLQVRRGRLDGSEDLLVGAGGGDASLPGRSDVASGGAFVVYESKANPTGANPEGNAEIFLWRAATGTTQQLTSTTTGENAAPRISRDGAWVTFRSNSPSYGAPNGNAQPYRLNVATGAVEPMFGLAGCSGWPYPILDPELVPIAIDGAGLRAFHASEDACVPSNADRSVEIFVTDYTVAPRITVSGGVAPTTLAWDVEPGVATYDVLRGDVANLGFNADTSVDLGDVVCIENDSPDNTTANAPDLDTPLPGQVLFYLYRGGAGSYGASSAGGARVPGSGGCAD